MQEDGWGWDGVEGLSLWGCLIAWSGCGMLALAVRFLALYLSASEESQRHLHVGASLTRKSAT